MTGKETDVVSGFVNPPVSETAMALEFESVPGLGIWELVKLQDQWSESLPEHQVMLGAPPNFATESIALPMPMPPLKVWLSNNETGLLLQTQSDRFILNWRKTSATLEYPGYEEVLRPAFERMWGEFLVELDARGLVPPAPALAEFTYVNRITGEGLSSPTFTMELLPASLPNLPGLEQTLAVQTIRTLDDGDGTSFKGHLSITAVKSAGEDVLHLTITTRVELGGTGDPLAGLDFARNTSKNAFLSVTATPAQQMWGPKA